MTHLSEETRSLPDYDWSPPSSTGDAERPVRREPGAVGTKTRRSPFKLTLIVILLVCGVGLLWPGFKDAPGSDVVFVEPGMNLREVIEQASPGASIVLMAGNFWASAPIEVRQDGVSLSSAMPGTVTIALAEDFQGDTMFRVTANDVRFQGLKLDGHFRTAPVKAIEAEIPDGEGATRPDRIQITHCEVTRFTHHALDVDGDDSVIDSCRIGQILWKDRTGVRQDAHGIVSTDARRLVIRNCDIGQCSGDAIQVEHGDWDEIRIVDCRLWDRPLEHEMGGFEFGTYVSENAIDTKHRSHSPGRLAIVNCTMSGFQSSLISNSAALNLKENVDVVIDGCEVLNCEIGFRVRGRSKGMNMSGTVMNSVIRNNRIAFRFEDGLQDFRMLHCTLLENPVVDIWEPRAWTPSSWVVANNLFIGDGVRPEFASPTESRARGNLMLSRHEVSDALIPISAPDVLLPEPCVPHWYEPTGFVSRDYHGHTRPTSTTVGAIQQEPRAGLLQQEATDQIALPTVD